VRSEAGEEPRHVDARVGLVDHLDIDGDVRSEYLPLGDREAALSTRSDQAVT
jgi:hypothetical protein